MAITPGTWIPTLFGTMTGMGFVGVDLIKFCTAVANGSVLSIVGKTFVTVDTGLTIGPGVGVGTGLFSVPPATVESTMLVTGVGFGFIGARWPDVCTAVSQALVTEIALASLASTHAPVFLGAGVITPGSIVVTGAEVAANIFSEGTALGFIGAQWFSVCTAIGAGYQAGFPTATGNVTITGAWSGLPPLPPGGTPGGGAGTGVIS